MLKITLLALLLCFSLGRIYNIKISAFKGQATLLSTFGHTSNGLFQINMKNLEIHNLVPGVNKDEIMKHVGFVYKSVISDTLADWETVQRGDTCFTERLKSPYFMFKYNQSAEISQQISQGGLYGLFFYHCEKVLHLPISFEISIIESNVIAGVRQYLSVGEIPLIFVFLGLSFFFFGLSVLWIVTMVRNRDALFKIHYLMGILVCFKSLSLFFEGIRFIDINFNGYSVWWSILYYIFTILKAFMLFVVILLLGSGWSFIKPYLNDFEKQLLLVILSLQVVSNISMVVIEQTAEGASSWLYWKQILLWVDVICCCLVLPAIAWSIRNLKNAKDEKSMRNAIRLSQFQQFYLVVIGYLYFTRIISLFIKDALPHNYGWIPDFLSQLVSMGLFIFTGYRFRPMKDNPYTKIKSDSEDELNPEELDTLVQQDDEDDQDFQLGDETHEHPQLETDKK